MSQVLLSGEKAEDSSAHRGQPGGCSLPLVVKESFSPSPLGPSPPAPGSPHPTCPQDQPQAAALEYWARHWAQQGEPG